MDLQANRLDAISDLLQQICETPAPTFEEEKRAELVTNLWKAAGLNPVSDEAGNVMADVPGGLGPQVLIAAHLDTVFARDVDVSIKHKDGRLAAPGIGDNSASLAVLSYYLMHCQKEGLQRPRLSVAATVGEEGLGDLKGIRQVMATRAKDFDAVIALDGHLGTVVNQSVGSKRFEVQLEARGGHSWGDFPSSSAVHALGDAIHALNKLSVPRDPRSSYNIGVVSGGTSINAIAQEARFNLDLRSLKASVLESMEKEALKRIRRVARQHEVSCTIEQVGDRPTAEVENAFLIKAAKRALASAQVPVRLAASSTDANAAMAVGLPAIAFGVYRGGDAHRLSEWLEPASLLTGYRVFDMLMQALYETS